MATTTDNVIINATINGKKAEEELVKLQQQAKKLRAAIAEAAAAGDTKQVKALNNTLRQTNAEAKSIQKQLFDVNSVLKKLSTASVKELQLAFRKLKADMESGHIKRGTKEWDEHKQKLKQVAAELANVRNEQKQTQGGFGKFVDAFNRFGAVGASFLASITGISITLRKCAADAARMDDAYADVMKTTGMTRNQVVQLNDSFMAMDTRTSREQLNALAATAGKLGITSQSDVLQFVEAANEINVALGEDLGEDAIKQIGKMVGVFGDCTDELKDKDLKGQILSVGSALNELGATSSASEAYLVQFAARLGGTARQAGISMDNILGFASALDQDMQQVEMSATAFQNVLIKMMSEPAKFARIAKMDVGEFTKLVKTDTNSAMIKLLQTLKQTGDFEALTPVLEEMGLTGSRATGVLTSMANSVDKITEAQAVANQAISEGVSITNEYNTKNNNLQAQLEKAKKSFLDASIALGEKLSPILLKSTKATTYLVKGLSQLLPWLKENRSLVVSLASAWGVYVAAKNKALIVSKAKNALTIVTNGLQATAKVVTLASAVAYNTLAGSQTRAAAASRALKLAMASTPWGAILTAITTIAVAVYKWATSKTALQKATSEMNKSLATEITQSNLLFAAAQRAAEGTKRRADYIKTINERYGEFLPNLLTEKSTNEELARALKVVNAELQRKYALQMKEQATGDIVKESTEEQVKLLKKLKEEKVTDELRRDEIIQDFITAVKDGDQDAWWNALEEFDKIRANKHVTNFGVLAKAYQRSYNNMLEQLSDVDKLYNNILLGNTAERLHGMNKEELDAWIADTKNANSEYLELAKKLRSDLDKLPEVETNGAMPTVDSTTTTQNDKTKERLEQIEKSFAAIRAQLMVEYATGVKNRQQYQEAINDVDLQEISEKMNIYSKGSKEYLELQTNLLQKSLDIQKSCEATSLAELTNHFNNQRNIIKKEFVDNKISFELYQKSLNTIQGNELKARIDLYQQGTEEYKQAEQAYNDWLLNDNFQTRKSYDDKLKQFREQYIKKSNQELMQLELDAFNELCRKIIISEEEKQTIIAGIRKKYNNGDANGSTLNANVSTGNLWSDLFGADLDALKSNMDQIQQFVNNGTLAVAEGMKHKAVIIGQFLEQQMNKWSSVIQGISSITSAVSELVQAEFEAQSAAVTARYDTEIEAAGKNAKKVAQLEQAKETELNQLQAEANEKAFGIEIAQAIANTALGAISAYASASAIPFAGWVLGPIAAAMATAAGAIQIATIRKQYQASKANYYTGGFTPHGKWDEIQGNVHSDEFVANRFAVSNKEIRPVLNLIDNAQKNNTVGSLTSVDVSRVLNSGGTNAADVTTNNNYSQHMAASVDNFNATNQRLLNTLDNGIVAVVSLDGQLGLINQQKKWNMLHNNKTRK